MIFLHGKNLEADTEHLTFSQTAVANLRSSSHGQADQKFSKSSYKKKKSSISNIVSIPIEAPKFIIMKMKIRAMKSICSVKYNMPAPFYRVTNIVQLVMARITL